MSHAPRFTPSPAFDLAARTLERDAESFWFNRLPVEQSQRLLSRIRTTAQLLVRTAGIAPAQARDAVAQALRFPSWHSATEHLHRPAGFTPGRLPEGWLDALSACVVLLVEPEDDVALSAPVQQAFEALARTLAMLTDLPTQQVLDRVIAPLCGEADWSQVRLRNPLETRRPLYRFITDDGAVEATDVAGPRSGDAPDDGFFDESAAGRQLDEQLHAIGQQGDATPSRRPQVRQWIEHALALQPGFLEGGLALAWIQRDEEPTRALATATDTLSRAEALMPEGYRGRARWTHPGNRVYLRLLWLVMALHHERGRTDLAIPCARKLLHLNPQDEQGVRHVLPMLLLEQGETTAARHALQAVEREHGLTAAAMRAFIAHAEGHHTTFRRELATALFTLPQLRAFLLDDPRSLAADESGHRAEEADLETFRDFAWPAYRQCPGLRRACTAFLAEAAVQQAEQDLRRCWAAVEQDAATAAGREPAGADPQAMWRHRLTRWVDRVAFADPTGHGL